MLSMENLNQACRDFMANSALNTLPEFGKTKIFETPLIGVASAKDPLFSQLKKAVAPHHLLPEEWLPSAQSVISFFLPFTEAITASNRGMGGYISTMVEGALRGGRFFHARFLNDG